MAHIPETELARQLSAAAEQVAVGQIYCHYKNPARHYRVVGLGIQESDEAVAVIYQALYGSHIMYVRPLESWLSTVEVDDVKTPRFSPVN